MNSIGTNLGVAFEPFKEEHWNHSKNIIGRNQGTAFKPILEKHSDHTRTRINQRGIGTNQMVQNQIGTNQETLNQSNWKQLNGNGINLVVALEPSRNIFGIMRESIGINQRKHCNQSRNSIGTNLGIALEPFKKQQWNHSSSSIGIK